MSNIYLSQFFRQVRKRFVFYATSFVGLAVSFAVLTLSGLFLLNEYSFDKQHKNLNNLYVVENEVPFGPQKGDRSFLSPTPLAEALKSGIPEILGATRVKPGVINLKYNQSEILKEPVIFIDDDFLSMFTMKIISGSIPNTLSRSQLLISRSVALRYFGKSEAAGLTLMDSEKEYQVIAVFDDVEKNSSLEFSVLLNIESISPSSFSSNWASSDVVTVLHLDEQSDLRKIVNGCQLVVQKETTDLLKKVKEFYPNFNGDNLFQLSLFSFKDIHFSTSNGPFVNRGKIENVILLSGITMLIFLISVLNFGIISASNALGRQKEIAVKKVLGSTKTALRRQFLFETLIFTAATAVAGSIIATFSLNEFNQFIHTDISTSSENLIRITIGLCCAVFVVTLLAAYYPAWRLSKKDPHSLLHNKIDHRQAVSFSLNVAQFSICLFLGASSWIMYKQFSYMANRDLGIDADQIMQVSALGYENKSDLLSSFTGELKMHPSIAGVTAIADFPFFEYNTINTLDNELIAVYSFRVDHHWLEVLGLNLISGQNFAIGSGEASNDIIVNETLAKMVGGSNAIGKSLPGTNYTIIGIVANFHYESLLQTVAPTFFRPSTNGNELLVRFSDSAAKADVLNIVQQAWNKVVGEDRPMTYSFLNDMFKEEYNNIEKWKYAMAFSCSYGIFISCFALFGLSRLQLARKVKMVAIHKILGANVFEISWLLTKPFVGIAVLSGIVVSPIIYLFITDWLTKFAYRIEWKWFWLPTTACILCAIILATVILNVIRSVRENITTALNHIE